jgi:hypothetical protein
MVLEGKVSHAYDVYACVLPLACHLICHWLEHIQRSHSFVGHPAIHHKNNRR